MSANDRQSGRQGEAPRTFLEFAEAKAALAEAVRAAASTGNQSDISVKDPTTSAQTAGMPGERLAPLESQVVSAKSDVAWGLKSRREDKVKRLIDQLQVQRPSNEGRLPGGKSIPALPTSRDAWLPASRLKQDKI